MLFGFSLSVLLNFASLLKNILSISKYMTLNLCSANPLNVQTLLMHPRSWYVCTSFCYIKVSVFPVEKLHLIAYSFALAFLRGYKRLKAYIFFFIIFFICLSFIYYYHILCMVFFWLLKFSLELDCDCHWPVHSPK